MLFTGNAGGGTPRIWIEFAAESVVDGARSLLLEGEPVQKPALPKNERPPVALTGWHVHND